MSDTIVGSGYVRKPCILDVFEGLCQLDASAYGIEQRKDIASISRYVKHGARVIDVGCGYGIPTSQLSRDFQVSACDIQGKHTSKYDGQVKFMETVMGLRTAACGGEFKWSQPTSLPFADNSFDAMLLYAVIEHVPDSIKRQFLRECARIVIPGGKLFMFRAVNRKSVTEHVERWFGIDTHGDEVVELDQMKRVFSDAGLRLLKWGYQGWLPENRLPGQLVYWTNRLLTAIPFVNRFSHDYKFICEVVK